MKGKGKGRRQGKGRQGEGKEKKGGMREKGSWTKTLWLQRTNLFTICTQLGRGKKSSQIIFQEGLKAYT